MAKNFDAKRETYRLRGLIEGIFGGSEVKYGNRTRCRLSRSRKGDCLLMIVSHNLRTYMRTLALKELKIFVLDRTNPNGAIVEAIETILKMVGKKP